MMTALPPRCERQIGTSRRPPYTIQVCPRSAVPGTPWCDIHHDTVGAAAAARALDEHTARLLAGDATG